MRDASASNGCSRGSGFPMRGGQPGRHCRPTSTTGRKRLWLDLNPFQQARSHVLHPTAPWLSHTGPAKARSPPCLAATRGRLSARLQDVSCKRTHSHIQGRCPESETAATAVASTVPFDTVARWHGMCSSLVAAPLGKACEASAGCQNLRHLLWMHFGAPV